MKSTKTDTRSQTPPPAPLNPQQFPLQAQTDPTADRDHVRKVTHVHAPRQSQRPAERSNKKSGA
jgi:hypothetical protein